MMLGSIVLAGGRSRRMGAAKDSLPWGSTTLLGHTVETLLDCTSPVVVVARTLDQDLPPLPTECDVIHDERPGGGPLAAAATGLAFLSGKCDAALLCACDSPFLDAGAVGWLAEQLGESRGVVPEVDGHVHPLTAVFRLDLLPALRDLLARGETRARALASLDGVRRLDGATIDRFDPARRFLRDVDTRADYDAARRDADPDPA